MTILSVIPRVTNVRNQTSQAFATRSGLFCDSSCKFICRPEDVNVNQFGQNWYFTQIWEQLVDNSPTFSIISFLNLWSSRHGVKILYTCLAFVSASSQSLSTNFFAWPSRSWDQTTVFAWCFSQASNFWVAPAEIRDSKIFWVFLSNT